MSLTLFNIIVDNVIQTWLAMTVEYQRVANDGLGEAAGRCLGLLYADYGMVGFRYHEWLQHSINVLVCLFRQYGLAANVTKSRTMTCQPRALRLGMSAEAKALECTEVVDSYRVRLRRRIPCPGCGIELDAGSMTEHRCHMHRTEPTIYLNRLPVIQMEHHP